MSERRRLSPANRRDQLLDVARDIVEAIGVGACTIDAVSQEAGVTPQLVHKYFGTRSSLLQELFCREDDRYQDIVRVALADASDFEDIVRVFVTANFDQLSSATAIGQLRVVPEVAAIRDERQQAGGRSAERVLVRALAAEHPATSEATDLVLRLGSAASIEAGNIAAQRPDRNRDRDIERTVRFILAGIRELVG
ncbi:MAG: TetR/AcrR family transcriptional regulator [Acidimicrobiales bacterium]|nr:TetR/AcrR family transcriptional regulator [Acidimicrobiales bacterium]MDG2216760.1 TetR/AcrR family transcriptional regulator [Acidimicrobiales bacterium]